MAKKILIKCPKCGTYHEAKVGFFQSKILKCGCGYKIDLAAESIQTKVCPHCGNSVTYDSTDYEAKCPVCGELINKKEDLIASISLTCPTCSCKITVNKNDSVATCPMCGDKIDVQALIKKEEAKKLGQASVIKYDGANNIFVYKHPIEDFNCGTQLIVHESQEAIFFKDGKAYDTFGAGRYTLSKSNMPLLEDLYKSDDPNQVLHSEIYFVNKTTQMNIKWGTDSKVRLLDPESNIYVEIGACGTFNMAVADARKLLIKLVGTEKSFGQDDLMGTEGYGTEYMSGKFKSLVMNKVKSNLARIIVNSKISVITIDQYIDLISERMKDVINEVLAEYGLYMPQFFITTIILPDDDPNYQRLKQQYAEKTLRVRDEEIKAAEAKARQDRIIIEHETDAKVKVVDSQGYVDTLKMKAEADAEAYKVMAMAEAEGYRAKAMAEADEMKAKGYTYKDETSRIVAQNATLNGALGGDGGAMNAVGQVASLGVAFGTVGAVSKMTKDAMKPIMDDVNEMAGIKSAEENAGWTCPVCGKSGITSNFCPDCGIKKPEVTVTWTCPNCGKKDITSRFCPDCGSEKAEK